MHETMTSVTDPFNRCCMIIAERLAGGSVGEGRGGDICGEEVNGGMEFGTAGVGFGPTVAFCATVEGSGLVVEVFDVVARQDRYNEKMDSNDAFVRPENI